ncbi:MAG: nucleotidyltransferase family protein [Candidatus Paceibacterota bacterium]|jgi:hypothetical protein
MSIDDIKNKIAPILKTFGVKYAAVFGSVSRGEDRSNSDIDMLVRLGKPMGMFSFMNLANSLEDSLGRKVDLITENSLNHHLKPFIIPELKTVYEG